MDLTLWILALIQGLTEFLPISSSAHLILVPKLLGWDDQGLSFDVAVHVGTLLAVLWYFRQELRQMGAGWWRSLSGRGLDADGRLAWAVLLATVPACIAALSFDAAVEQLRSPIVIAWATIGFGLLLGLADWFGPRRRDEQALGWWDALMIGLAQALALIPGTSRSGITMTAGLALGFTAAGAARFSFLLAIPIIMLAGLHETAALVAEPTHIGWGALAGGAAVSGVTAYLTIHYFLALVARVGMWPFVVYRLLLGVLLLVVFA